MIDIDLSGKRAIVCGSSRGIGRAVAIELASMGASITLIARSAPHLSAVKELLDRSEGQEHHMLLVDFQNPDKLKSALDRYLRLGNSATILVNNTGGPAPGMAQTATIQEFESAFRMHLLCNHILVQALLPEMKTNKYGRIINIISTSVKQPIPNLGVSNTIRGAVANWAKTLASELGPFGVTVNNILPGFIETDRLHSLVKQSAKMQGIEENEQREKMVNTVPARRMGRPDEIGSAVGFLCTDQAAYINGINLPVDGGKTLSL